MTICRFADITVGFENRHPYFPQFVKEYSVASKEPELWISVTDEEITTEEKAAGEALKHPALLEATALWRRFCHRLPELDAFLLHAACLAVDGCGIAFSAPSGVGKSTHIAHWCDILGQRCRVINGDKPILRRGRDGDFLGYGTPFCGKEDWQENSSVPLRTLCFLERGTENRVTPMTSAEAFPLLFAAVPAPESEGELALLLPLLSDFLSHLALYRITCTERPEAARLAIEALL